MNNRRCHLAALKGARVASGLVVQVSAGNLTSWTLIKQPGMDYLTGLSQRKDVNWQLMKLAHDHWSYKQGGLAPTGATLVGAAKA